MWRPDFGNYKVWSNQETMNCITSRELCIEVPVKFNWVRIFFTD